MALEVSPSGRGMLVIGGLLLGLAVFTQTSGYWLTGVVILVVTALVLLVVWGAGTRLLRWVGGIR